MQRPSMAVAAALALLSHLALVAGAAAHGAVTYRHQTQDLLPQQDLDLAIGLEGTAWWSLEDASLAPGERAEAGLRPSQGPMDLTLQYRFRMACCAEQVVQGVESVQADLVLGRQVLRDVPVGDRIATLTLTGSLRAQGQAQGPGTITLPRQPWADWDAQPVAVEAHADAGAGQRVAVAVQTRYGWSAEVVLADEAGGETRASTGTLQAPGDMALRQEFPVGAAEGGSAARAVPLPAAAILASLAGAALLTRRRAP
jgi:hypothetical protein